MSLNSEIDRITDQRNRIRAKLHSLGLLGTNPQRPTGFTETLSECTDAIETIGGAAEITTIRAVNVADKQTARISASDRLLLVPDNIKSGVSILGVAGSLNANNGTPPPTYTWYYGNSGHPVGQFPQNGFGKVVIKKSEDSGMTLKKENIRDGVMIMGVVGGLKRPNNYFRNGGFGHASPSNEKKVVFELEKTITTEGYNVNAPTMAFSEAPLPIEVESVIITILENGGANIDSGEFKRIIRVNYAKWKTLATEPISELCEVVVFDSYNESFHTLILQGFPFQLDNVNGNARLSLDLENVTFYKYDSNGELTEYQYGNYIKFDTNLEYRVDIKW